MLFLVFENLLAFWAIRCSYSFSAPDLKATIPSLERNIALLTSLLSAREEKGMTEDEMVGWHHRLSGHEFE